MSKTLPPLLPINTNFTDRCGQPLAGGKVFIYEQHSLVPKDTWSDVNGQFKNTHPIILDEAGNAGIYYEGLARVVVYDNRGTKIHDVDNHGFPTTSSVDKSLPKASASGMPLGSIYWWNGKELPLGAVAANGQLVRREDYPYLWADMEAGKYHIVTDERWLESPRYRGLYSLGDGVSTFRVPDLNGAMQDSIKSPVLRGGQSTSIVPTIQADTVREISGNIGFNANLADDDQGDVTYQIANFDASLTVPTASALGSYVIQLSNGYDPKGIVTSINGLFGDVEIPRLDLEFIDADDSNTDPLEPIEPPPPSVNITINTLSATKNTKPTISGTGESGRTVSIVIAKAGATIQTLSAIVGSNGTWSTVPDTALSNGAHTITASHTNSVGNTTTASTTLMIDTTAPALTVTPIATGTATNITVSGTSEAGAAIKVTIGSISLTTTSNGTWEVNTTLAVGTHTINVSATDAAGNVANASTTVTITSDATEPTDPVEPNLDNLYNKELINKGWYVTQLGAITSAGAANPEWSMFILPVEQGATYRLKLSIASPQKLAWHDTLEPVAAYQAISLAIATVDPSDPSFYLVTVPDNPAIISLAMSTKIILTSGLDIVDTLEIYKV